MPTLIEAKLFSRIVYDYLDDLSYALLQQQLSENRELGVLAADPSQPAMPTPTRGL